MSKIAIIGSSFGGLTAAYELRRRLSKAHEITVLSTSSQFVFLPSLPWVAMGWKRPEHIVFNVARPLERKGIRFVRGEATGIDPSTQKVSSTAGEAAYDYLVISTGSDLDFAAVPGLDPQLGNNDCIFTLDGAVGARSHLARILGADRGDIVVGSAQGASCLGPAYEFVAMVDTALRRRRQRHHFNLHFVTPEPFLGHFGVGGMGKARRLVEDEFCERDIAAHTSTAIEAVEPDRVVLRGGVVLRKDFAMIAPAFLGVEAVRNSEGLGNARGFVPVDEFYRHPQFANVYAVGVAVAMAPPAPTPVPTGVPKTGNMTVHMARTAAKNVAAALHGQDLEPESGLGVLCLDDMGDTAILLKAKPVLPPRQSIYHKKGRWVHWAKLGFERYFLWKMKHGLTQLPL